VNFFMGIGEEISVTLLVAPLRGRLCVLTQKVFNTNVTDGQPHDSIDCTYV